MFFFVTIDVERKFDWPRNGRVRNQEKTFLVFFTFRGEKKCGKALNASSARPCRKLKPTQDLIISTYKINDRLNTLKS